MPINTQSFGNAQAHSEMDQINNGSVTHRQDEKIRLTEIQRYLEGCQFPASKEDLVEHATENQAPRRIVDLLQQLQTPEFGSANAQKSTIYNSFDELAHEINQVQ
jgi:hypothetical protein